MCSIGSECNWLGIHNDTLSIRDRIGLRQLARSCIESCQKHYKDEPLNAPEDMAVCEDLLRFVDQRKELKAQTTAISNNIWPKNCTNMALTDIRVSSGGPDDHIFLHNKEMLYSYHQSSIAENSYKAKSVAPVTVRGEKCLVPVLQGLRKFTGGLGDDDDVPMNSDVEINQPWKAYFTKPIEFANTIISMDKANGEAAHLACRWIEGRFVLFCGSKNVHMSFTRRGDLDLYEGQRYMVAHSIAQEVLNRLHELPDGGQAFLAFLAATKLTANFEILMPSYQHVEPAGDKVQLVFFAFTAPHFDGKRSSFCDVHPVLGVEIIRELGLDTVDYEVFPFAAFDDHVAAIRRLHLKEGRVLYIMDGECLSGKKKSIWYVIVRAIREKIRTAATRLSKASKLSLIDLRQSCLKRTTARLGDIQRWLQFSDAAHEAWQALAKDFIHWLFDENHFITTKHTTSLKPPSNVNDRDIVHQKFHCEDVRCKFPTVWNAFLSETNQIDDIDPDM
eukprot:gene9118-1419_t